MGRGHGGLRSRCVAPTKLMLAKQFHRETTPAERTLWKAVRRKQVQGFRFRRQQVIEGFIVDFYCHGARLVIEVDGEIHAFKAPDDRSPFPTGKGDRGLGPAYNNSIPRRTATLTASVGGRSYGVARDVSGCSSPRAGSARPGRCASSRAGPAKSAGWFGKVRPPAPNPDRTIRDVSLAALSLRSGRPLGMTARGSE